MRTYSSLFSARTIAVWVGLAAVGAVAAPAACFYPSYTFNEPESAGGGGGGTPGSSTSKSVSTTTSSSVSVSSVSSSSGMPCGMGNFACVTEAPSGWTGYFTLYDGPAAMDPGCPPLFPQNSYTGDGGLNAPPISCSQCTCGTPTGQLCTVATFSGVGPLFVTNKTCAQFMSGTACGYSRTIPADGTCGATSPLPAGSAICGDVVNGSCPGGNQACNVGAVVGPTQVSGGTCAASPQNPTKPMAMWTTYGHACGYQGATMGCNIGQVCLPTTTTPYQPGICISKVGDNMCPQIFPNKHVYYDGVITDTRDCTPCTCGAVTGAGCTATIDLFTDSVCSANAKIVSIPAGGCVDLSGNPGVSGRKVVPTFTGSCAADAAGGKPTGSVTGQNSITYCCQ